MFRPLPRSLRLVLIASSISILACSSSASPEATTGPTESPIVVETPSASASPDQASAGPIASPSSTASVPAASPSPVASPTYTAAERRLLDALRADAHIGCAPRRTNLPTLSTAAVECHVDTALVDRVGVYGFGPTAGAEGLDPAIQTYLDKLAEYRVKPRTGDCQAGKPGDSSWPDYQPDEQDDGSPGYRPMRSGCFLDENGTANIRLTCYGDIYIGILGKNADIAALYAWAWRVAQGESTDRDPPGICAAPD